MIGAQPMPSQSRAEAQKRGIDLRFSDAQQKEENQIKSIRSLLLKTRM
jgi:hypothetical protein